MRNLHTFSIKPNLFVFAIFNIQFGLKMLFLLIETTFSVELFNLNYFLFLAITFQILIWIYKDKYKIKFHNFTYFVFLLFMIIITIELFWGIKFYLFSSSSLFKYFIEFYLNQILLIFLFTYIGYNFKKVIDVMDSNIGFLKLLPLVIYFLIIVLFVYSKINLSQNGELFYGTGISYIYLGDMFAIYVIFIVMNQKNKLYKLILFLVSLYFLQEIGSRSSLVFYLLAFVFSHIQDFWISRKKIFTVLICVVPIGIFLNILFNYNYTHLVSERVARILSIGLFNDYSFVARNKIFIDSLVTVRENIITGVFFAEFIIRNDWGLYIHSILSYLEEYGLVVFISLVMLIIYSLLILVKFNFINRNNHFLKFSLTISIFIILSTVFTRSYIYFYIWLTFGLVSSIMESKSQYIKKRINIEVNN